MTHLNHYESIVSHYTDELTGTGYLALRDIPMLIGQYSNGGVKTLDFGCGAGRSSRFLRQLQLGLKIDGADINKAMLCMAESCAPADENYHLITNEHDLARLGSYDIIFNCFVLFEIGCSTQLTRYLSALYGILNSGGILISVLNSNFLYSKNWLSVENDFEQNKNLQSGDIAKIRLPLQGNIELYDYFWLESDYIHFFKHAGFSFIKIHKPLGADGEGYAWKDELLFPPHAIYICKKVNS